MAELVPVDFDPFAAGGQQQAISFKFPNAGQPPKLVPVDFDPFTGPSPFASRFEGMDRPENAADLDRALNQSVPTSPTQRLVTDFENQGAAAGQRTTPNIGSQDKNLISSDVFENDAGHAVYRDPKTGELTEANKANHVILRDPADNRLKVYGRSEQTNEGVLSAAGPS